MYANIYTQEWQLAAGQRHVACNVAVVLFYVLSRLSSVLCNVSRRETWIADWLSWWSRLINVSGRLYSSGGRFKREIHGLLYGKFPIIVLSEQPGGG
jgi:hypothetical protein